MIKVKIKKLYEDSKIPTMGSEYAAGFDLYAHIDNENDNEVIIYPQETIKIGTGVAIQPPQGYFGAILARSGMATKQGLAPANKVGVCDEDYTGEYIVPLHNHSSEPTIVNNGDRIAQLVFLPYINAEFEEVEELNKTKRGDGGFGSSGTN